MIRIFGDFNSMDRDWIIQLTSVGSLKDLSKNENDLREGARVLVYDYDREGEGILERKGGIWIARIDIKTFREYTGPPPPSDP